MTRDEAITENYKYFRTALQIQGMTRSEDELRKMAAAQTDLYVALGMLKLDEADIDDRPARVFKIRKFMRNFHLESYSPGELEGALAMAGLKVVDE